MTETAEITASAADTVADGTCGSDVTWVLDSDGVFTLSGTGAAVGASYTINGDTTTGDSDDIPWFDYRSRITRLVVEDGITSIGDFLFYECTNLKSVTIADSVTSIGLAAFARCTSLEEFYAPANLTDIGKFAFQECTALTEVIFNDTLTSIGGQCFFECKSLTSVEIPASMTSIGFGSFAYCTTMTSVTVAEDNENYSNLDGVLFNKEQTELIYCPCAKAGVYIVPETVTTIDDSSFYDCYELTEITIPESVATIDSDAFKYCESLEKITFLNPDCEIYDDFDTICNTDDGFTGIIYGYTDSTAQAYAETYDYTFIALDEESITTTTTELTEETTEETTESTTTTDTETTEETTESTTTTDTETTEETTESTTTADTETTEAAVATGTTTTTATETESTTTTETDLEGGYAIGDVTLDQKTTLSDCILLNKAIAGIVTLNDTAKLCADVNADGNVDADDALILLKYQVNLITSLPYTE